MHIVSAQKKILIIVIIIMGQRMVSSVSWLFEIIWENLGWVSIYREFSPSQLFKLKNLELFLNLLFFSLPTTSPSDIPVGSNFKI